MDMDSTSVSCSKSGPASHLHETTLLMLFAVNGSMFLHHRLCLGKPCVAMRCSLSSWWWFLPATIWTHTVSSLRASGRSWTSIVDMLCFIYCRKEVIFTTMLLALAMLPNGWSLDRGYVGPEKNSSHDMFSVGRSPKCNGRQWPSAGWVSVIETCALFFFYVFFLSPFFFWDWWF